MKGELTPEKGERYLDHEDIGMLLGDVFKDMDENIMRMCTCYSAPCANPPCAMYNPNDEIEEKQYE